MKVKKEKLLIIAGIVWAIAGLNILRIGIVSYVDIVSQKKLPVLLWTLPLSLLILIGFGFMFSRVVKRNAKRIIGYSEKASVFRVFDGKGYALMIFMMGLGIGLRASHLLPTVFFAVFYTGLGTALFVAGCLFVGNYMKHKNGNVS